MKIQKEIILPVSAENCDLQEWAFTVPEGMEAVVENGKVIIRKKESDDETVRKELIEFINHYRHNSDLTSEQAEWCHKTIAWLERQKEPEDKGEISDGYHTFNELYYYRMLYNAAFFNSLPKEWVHKSKRHHSGEECFGGGWFIVMANLPTGQISNHYELKDWDLFRIPVKETADEWDGHTPQEAAERLHKFLMNKEWYDTDAEVKRFIKLALIASEEDLDAFWKVHGTTRKKCTDWLCGKGL